jgi:hypothetical protein
MGGLGASAQAVMAALAHQLQARRFDDVWREVDPGALGDARAELVGAGLLDRKEGTAAGLRLSREGLDWILGWLHLVQAFCPKCSTGVELPEGEPRAQGLCPTCGVGWIEDTTAKPFVPRYG